MTMMVSSICHLYSIEEEISISGVFFMSVVHSRINVNKTLPFYFRVLSLDNRLGISLAEPMKQAIRIRKKKKFNGLN